MMRRRLIGPWMALALICCLIAGQAVIVSPARASTIGITIDGKQLTTDAAPFIQDGRTLVPFRALFEALGATVNWDADTRTVSGDKNGKKISLAIDSKTAYVDGAPVALDVAAVISGGRTFVPLRFVGEALGADVAWDSASNTVKVALAPASPASPSPSTTSPPSSPSSSPSVSVSPAISIVDSFGNTVIVPKAPKRIVCTNSFTAETICALGAGDTLVGLSNTTVFPPVLKSVEKVGSWTTPSAEKIISLKPDLVLAYGHYTKQEILDKIEQQGIPVALINCYYPATMVADVTTLGKILGKEQRAAEFCDWYIKTMDLAKSRTKDMPMSERPTIYIEGYTDYSTNSAGSATQQLLGDSGTKNIASEFRIPFPKISPEWVVAKNPQVIIKAVSNSSYPSGYGQSDTALKTVRQTIMDRPGWSGIDAVKNGRVYMLCSEIGTTPHAPIGVLYIDKALYPDRFKDIDPGAINAAFLSEFFGLDGKGSYFYPVPQ